MIYLNIIESKRRRVVKILLSIFALVLISNTITAQKLNAKFSPLSLLDPSTPTLLMGAEFRMNRHWAVEADYGIKTNTGLLHWNSEKSQHHYFKLRSEVKYYIPFRKNNAYGGIAFFYVPQSYNNTSGTYFDKSGTKYDYDRAHLTKNIYGLCLKAGYVKKLSQRFSFEVFAGLGVRFIHTTLTNIEGKKVIDDFTEWFQTNDFEGPQKLIHVEAGVKINYLVIR